MDSQEIKAYKEALQESIEALLSQFSRQTALVVVKVDVGFVRNLDGTDYNIDLKIKTQ